MEREKFIVLIRLGVEDEDWEEPCAAQLGRLVGWLQEARGLLEDVLAVKTGRMFSAGEECPNDFIKDIRYLFC